MRAFSDGRGAGMLALLKSRSTSSAAPLELLSWSIVLTAHWLDACTRRLGPAEGAPPRWLPRLCAVLTAEVSCDGASLTVESSRPKLGP